MNEVKILSQTDTTATVGGYGVVFGGRDLEGETFTSQTDYALDLVPVKPVYYDHTQNGAMKNARLGSVITTEADDIGLWVEAELNKASEYTAAVLKLVERGVIGWSSGSVSHLARRDGGVIKSWPIVEFSLTPTPAEPRTLGVERIKSLYPDLAAQLPEIENEETDMSEQQEDKVPAVDLGPVLDAISSISNQVKAFGARVEALETKPTNDPGIAGKSANIITDTEHWKYDNYSGDDLALVAGVVSGAPRSRGVSPGLVKALAHRLESDESRKSEPATVARRAMKSAGIKANEVAQTTLANYGDEWVGVYYSGSLWESVRHETMILPMLPQIEVPAGAESIVIPLESTDPVWGKVSQAASLTSNPGGIVSNTVTASTLGTANKTLTVGKMGARVLWSGEMEEDAVLPYVNQLRTQLARSGAEYLEHVLIDGDTATGATTNINDIAGTPAGTEAFLILDGFRKSCLVTTTANSRDGGALAVEDYLETIKLMGLRGKNALDRTKVGFIIGPAVHWKTLQLTEVKTQDVFSAPTIENGQLTNIWGYPVMLNVHMHKANADATYGGLANSAGKLDLDTAGNNTTGVILAVRWDQWQFGWRRRMTLEMTRQPAADATEIVALMRFGMVQRDTEASAISYNLTI